MYANLEGIDLSWASLEGAYLVQANLRDAVLVEADLNGSVLTYTDFEGANLLAVAEAEAAPVAADLEGAVIWRTKLGGADLSDANLGGALFEPDSRNLLDVTRFVGTRNLWRMHYHQTPHALIALRNLFKESGWRHQEREITYAIKHTKVDQVFNLETFVTYARKEPPSFLEKVDAWFNLLFFEITTQWGMNPGRALIILLIFIPVFAVPYVVALRIDGKDGIWQKWSDERVRDDLGCAKPTRLQVGWSKAIGFGIYFSALSAFHIGWQDLKIGNWIARIQPREYTLRASGWVRTISGIQSLISVYLVAIWALTYFGRPFD